MRAARFMLARARVRPERRGRRRWWISLFSASLCLPSRCCWRRFWYLCAMLDYRWLFNIRARNACRFLGRSLSVVNPRKRGRERERKREINLSHWLNLAVNVYHNKKRVFACGYYRFHGCKNRCVRSGKYREVYKRLRTLIMKV